VKKGAADLSAARALIASGRHDEAVALCSSAVAAVAAGRATQRSAEALELRAEALRGAGRHDEAYADLDRLARLFPDDAWRLSARGEGARHRWDFAGAEADARRALALRPDDAGARILLAEALRGLGRFDESAAAAEAAAQADPGASWPLVVLAKAERYRDPARALAALDRAERRSPGDHYVAGWRAEVLLRLGRAADAATALDAALRRAPTISWLRALRGEARRAAKNSEAGLADVLEAFRLDGHFSCGYDFLGAEPPAVRRDKHLAWVYAWRGGWRRGSGADGAAADFDLALELDPGCAWARAWRGEARLAAGRAAEALADLEEARRVHPKWADPAVWLGRARLERGDASAALLAFQEASRADARHALAKVGEAVAYETLGRKAESKRALAAAVKLDPRLKESFPA